MEYCNLRKKSNSYHELTSFKKSQMQFPDLRNTTNEQKEYFTKET